jgi:hypothetical protein
LLTYYTNRKRRLVVRPQGFRDNLVNLLVDELDEQGFDLVSDCVYGEWDLTDPELGLDEKQSIALDRAMREAYNSLQTALKKLSRIATRLDYLEKESK